jgi:high-affinity Fe2+/Pb2+ permease
MTLPASPGPTNRDQPGQAPVAKTAIISIGAIASGIATIVIACGNAGIPNEIIEYCLSIFFGLSCVALLLGALHICVNRDMSRH